MFELALDARLAYEPRDRDGVAGAAPQALDRDAAPDALVVGRYDLAHATLAQQRAELVIPETFRLR